MVVVVGTLTIAPLRCTSNMHDAAVRTMRISLIDHGYHIGLVLPASTPWYNLATEFNLVGHGDMVEVGWGDRTFYMNDGFDAGKALSALFWGSSGSVLHVWLRDSAARGIDVYVSPKELAHIASFVQRSAKRDAAGSPLAIADGYYGASSKFIHAHASYSIANTCNQWTSNALMEAGLCMPVWCVLPESVKWSVAWQR